MSDTLIMGGNTYSGTIGFKATDSSNNTITYIKPSGTKSISSNGTGIDVTEYAAVDVSVSGGSANLQTKTNIDPTESSQTIEPDSGYDGLSSVQINAISSSYVGSGITRRTGSDLYFDWDDYNPSNPVYTVYAPNGYYSGGAYKAVPTGTAGTPTASKGAVSNHSVSVTPSVTNSAGYISGGTKTGTAVTVSASELVSGTKTINASGSGIDVTEYAAVDVAAGSATPAASISGTSASVSTGTNTLTLSKTVSNTPQVTAGYVSSGTSGNTSVSLTASVTTKAAATITPGTSNQTIASGTYLTGAQTISGDANLVAGNIKNGVSIFGVSGSLAFSTITVSSSNPSGGNNGDVWIKTS